MDKHSPTPFPKLLLEAYCVRKQRVKACQLEHTSETETWSAKEAPKFGLDASPAKPAKSSATRLSRYAIAAPVQADAAMATDPLVKEPYPYTSQIKSSRESQRSAKVELYSTFVR